MFINVDLTTNKTELAEPEDCTRFHVQVTSSDERATTAGVVRALGALGHAGEDDEHVWIDIAGIRALAAGCVGETWTADFDGMVTYAASKGWLDDDQASIQAHLEWS